MVRAPVLAGFIWNSLRPGEHFQIFLIFSAAARAFHQALEWSCIIRLALERVHHYGFFQKNR
jgi:hypothetical protein